LFAILRAVMVCLGVGVSDLLYCSCDRGMECDWKQGW
jgi:hypothetical protein